MADGQEVTGLDPERLRVALAVHTAWPFGVGEDPKRARQVLAVYQWLYDTGRGLDGEAQADLVYDWEAYVWQHNIGHCRDMDG